jgi:hypothetical protein
VKEFDDLLSATRYAWMMRRFAVVDGGDQYEDDYSVRASGWML